MSDNADLHKRVLTAFQAEFQEQMHAIQVLLAVWPAASGVVLDEAFRMAHSMKGSARVCDLGEVEAIAHQLEHVLAQLARGEASPTPALRSRIEQCANAAEDTMAVAMMVLRPPDSRQAPGPGTSAPAAQETLRIDVSQLDRMLQSAGQLATEAVLQERLQDDLQVLAKELDLIRRDYDHGEAGTGEERARLRSAATHLQQIRTLQRQAGRQIRVLGEELQRGVRHIRLVPAGSVFEGFPKMMRDLAGEMGKPVHFTMTGGEHQADRAVLQALKDPVMHALRNALSHGIESRAERRASGKPETAEISLTIESAGHLLRLHVADDGAGVDLRRVRAQALQRGLLTSLEADALPEDQWMDFIFHSGFSTSLEVNTVSGRGMGLSVVKERAAELQGSARMRSQPGRGSTLSLEVPVTLATHRLLLVRTNGKILALPLRAIESVRRVKEVHTVEGRSVILQNNIPLPLATLGEATASPPRLVRSADGHLPVVVLRGKQPLALHVEMFLGEIDALVRPLPFPASRSPHYIGGVLTEDGTVALVLNVDSLFDRLREGFVPEEKAVVPASRQPTVLVVDDSFTARTLQKSILETAGYRVRVAVDGMAALDILRSQAVDVVVSDIQMPRMSGFDLLAAMKGEAGLTEIPLVLVTSLSSKEDQERGMSLGAEAYIVKERFDHQELLAVVRQLI
ncbi:MAG: putative gliding motility regulatory protein [Verrucomicrobiaceae bacterium]|nr:putative gliding motility regulatory protein [Verrucomicrobiaceae bacterium]